MAIRLITIDPGHFHAALVQKQTYPEVMPEALVFSPDGPELDRHLELIGSFNARATSPTAWKEIVCRGDDYLDKFVAAVRGGASACQSVVVLAGKNDRKGDYALAAVESGCHVLADKPLGITTAVFAQAEKAARLARSKGLCFADIMTERNEITQILQRALAADRDLYGEQQEGSADDPAVVETSMHHFFKLVNGMPLRRPGWYYDTRVQGEGIADVTAHLVDLVQWKAFPDAKLVKEDASVLSARVWPTVISPEQFRLSTGETTPNPIDCLANGEFTWRLRNVVCKVSVAWDFQAAPGVGDTHDSRMRGTKAEIFIRQDKKEGSRPLLHVRSRGNAAETGAALERALKKISADFGFVGLSMVETDELGTWRIVFPAALDVGHEEHFGLVVQTFLAWLKAGAQDPLYVDNMLVKYHTIVEAMRRAHGIPG